MEAPSIVYSYLNIDKQFRNSPKSWQENGGESILFGHWVLGGDQSGRVLENGDPGGSIAVLYEYVIHDIEKTQVWVSANSDVDLNSDPLREWYGNPTSDEADIQLTNGHTIQVRLDNPDNHGSGDQSLHVFLNGRDLDSEPYHHDNRTPLHYACANGWSDQVKRLIDTGADVNAKDNYEVTPLHWACGRGHVDTIKLSIDYGADVNAMDNDGVTPLHWACGWGQVDAAKLSIDFGADVNAMDSKGKTPLHYACGHGQVDLAKLLIEKGADVNPKDSDGDTVKGKEEMNNDNGGATPLHYACWWGQVDVAKLLIEKGADVNAKDRDENTPLRWAMMTGKEEMTNFLTKEEREVGKEEREVSIEELTEALARLTAFMLKLL